jgi:DNA-directed RNA polymerase subunit N (RpoN/RPB10)
MLVPVRCFTCNKVIGGLYEKYIIEKKKNSDRSEKELMDEFGIHRLCCRRHFLTTIVLIDKIT